ncbi:MAG: hypothetical protein ACRDZP_01520 [Acidimicrobiales bacterium]
MRGRSEGQLQPGLPVAVPGGLVAGQLRPKVVRLVKGADWYAIGPGRFDQVGAGDLSMKDIEAVGSDLPTSPWTAFVCVARPREVEDVLGPKNNFGLKRITWSARQKGPMAPTLAAVARGARIALLPGTGVVWVDSERLFARDDSVPLPWTDPLVSMKVVRPKVVREALRREIGPHARRRALLLSAEQDGHSPR